MDHYDDLWTRAYAQAFHHLRTAERISQQEVADLAGVTQGTVSNAELGKNTNITSAIRIAQALGWDWPDFTRLATYFFEREQNASPMPEDLHKRIWPPA